MSGQWDESTSGADGRRRAEGGSRGGGSPRGTGARGGSTRGSGTRGAGAQGAGTPRVARTEQAADAGERVPAPRPGGRAEARRAAQGKGGGRGRSDGDGAADASTAGGRAAARNSRKPKRNVKKIVAWSVAGVLVVLAGTGGAIYYKLNGNIKSFDPEAVSTDRPPEATADANGNKPVNVLLIGSDSRAGKNSDLGGGNEGGARSDTTILLHVYADHKHAVGISIPRDALVTIPRCKLPNGTWSKEASNQMFNSAFSVGNSESGNPACTQNTVEKLTGIRVDHTIEVNFEGFAAMTEAVDGVDVCLPNDIYEGHLNPNLGKKGKIVLPKGKQKLSGQKALDYVRLRHGIGDESDVGRMKRQQAFLASLMAKVKGEGLSPTTLLPLADAATKSMTVDPGLDSAKKLMDFALSMKSIDLHDVKFLTAPWRYNGPRIDLVHPAVDNLWKTLLADRTIDGQDATGKQDDAPQTPTAAPETTTAAPSPAAVDTPVKVAVFNGTTASGLAAKAAETLKAAKVTVTGVSTAKNTNKAVTTVEYGSGQKANAEKVAALFPNSTLVPTSAAGISLVLGKDFAAANAAAAPAAAAPSVPAPLPTEVVNEARSADDDICSNVSYG
ncbi:LCP family protein [Streptomyces sp. CB01881]|uniref:LCP family protein n=1 Tax=Streptomyces sp. CB01881 TaxID=2078691 RepID=UPI000CDBFFAE|nr:LCP family protein [Streptomyces sp. CB01881]AUY50583.1 LytR family transcriptional regulator [Streptomyces sp. CB01881]TYC73971.1 LytR family transcriptional regulator [Streptomyces sp. CB01881]